MHSSLSLLALAASATAQIRGFNYGALYADKTARQLADWEADFKAAQKLPGVGGFTSARIFTMIQGYSQTSEVISALPAAAATNTSLLLGLWCSAGDDAFQQEITALRTAITQYGEQLQDLIVGISVGSEDLYRVTPTGIENDSGPGATPKQLVNYISQVRDVIKGTPWADKQIGHVDTWTAYVNSSNNAVIEALDWVGVDTYPYYETVNDNSIENAGDLFFDALSKTEGAAMGKPVWVTETGWPVTGPASGKATSGTKNAETYWKAVACKLLGNRNTWWYELNDGADEEVSFRVINPNRGAPLYDLSCSGQNTTEPSASATSSASGSATSSVKSGSASATGSSSSGSQSAGSPNMAGQNSGRPSEVSGGSPAGYNSTTSTSSSGNSAASGGYGSGSGSGSGSSSSSSSNTTHSGPSAIGSNPPSYTGAAANVAGSVFMVVLLAFGAAVSAM